MFAVMFCTCTASESAASSYDDEWRPPDAAVYRSSTIGGSQVLDCDLSRQPVSLASVIDTSSLTTERIMTWRRRRKEVPIFIQFNGYPPHVDEMYQVCRRSQLSIKRICHAEVSKSPADKRSLPLQWPHRLFKLCNCYLLDLKATLSSESKGNKIRTLLRVHRPCAKSLLQSTLSVREYKNMNKFVKFWELFVDRIKLILV